MEEKGIELEAVCAWVWRNRSDKILTGRTQAQARRYSNRYGVFRTQYDLRSKGQGRDRRVQCTRRLMHYGI